MKLVDRLRARLEAGIMDRSATVEVSLVDVRAAIERIEAADAVDGELPANVLATRDVVAVLGRDALRSIRDYRALADRQDGGE